MMKYPLLVLIFLGPIASVFPATITHALTLTNLSSDQEMEALLPKISFVAEGRIGDRGGFSTHEINLHEEDPGSPQVTEQFNWLNGKTEAFELTYNAESNLVNYMLGNKILSYAYTQAFSDIFLRTRAIDAGASIIVDNLVLDSQNIHAYSSAIGEIKGLDILRISDIAKSFRLAGNVTMSWTDEAPRNSRLAYQIKIGTPTSDPPRQNQKIPEPSSIYGILTVFGLSVCPKLNNRKIKS
jgi:hypothetical protein